MTNGETLSGSTVHHAPPASPSSIVLRVPKLNMQVVILGLVAIITIFQTIQLIRISAKAAQTPVPAVPAVSDTTSGGTGGAGDVPQSMVGGC